MWKKIILLVAVVIIATAAQAQIGYKGQITLAASAGLNQNGGMVAAACIGGYVSQHSVIGLAVLYDRTRYNAGGRDSFFVAQWLGNINYQYSLSMGKFMLMPTGGVLLGMERSDPLTSQGNLVRNGSQFVYGLALEFGVEYILGRHWAVAIEPRLSYLINANFDSVKVSASAGFKYYF